MESPGRPYRLTADGVVGASGKPLEILAVIVGKAVSGGTIAIYNGTSTGGTLIATLAMDAAQSFQFGSCFMDGGVYLDLTGSSPDVTVIAR